MNTGKRSPEWHIARLSGFERHILRTLDGTANGGQEPAGAYRAKLEKDLAWLRRHIASYAEKARRTA